MTDTLVKFDYSKGAGGLSFWRSGDCPEQIDASWMVEHICSSEALSSLNARILKTGKRVTVFGLDSYGKALIFKTYRFRRFKDKRRYRRFALSEIRNNLSASEAGIFVPRCYGYYEVRPFRYGFVSGCGVIMEDLLGYVEFGQYYKQTESLLSAVIPILVELYQKGVNHIDISPSNVFINPKEGGYAIIDWQYCSFHRPCNDIQLILHARKYLRYIPIDKNSSMCKDWLGELHDRSGSKMPSDEFLKKVASLEGRKIYLKERLSLDAKKLDLL